MIVKRIYIVLSHPAVSSHPVLRYYCSTICSASYYIYSFVYYLFYSAVCGVVLPNQYSINLQTLEHFNNFPPMSLML